MTAIDRDLKRIVDLLGNNRTAEVLGVNKSLVSRWLSGKEPISGAKRRLIVDAAFILHRALQVLSAKQLALWLSGSEPTLGGARPLDVLTIRGVAPLISALDAIEQDAYA
jgi:hypothetical protein